MSEADINIINATPHALSVFDGDRKLLYIPASGSTIRLTKSRQSRKSLCAMSKMVPVIVVTPFDGYDDPDNLLQKPNSILVSMVVAQYLRDHHPEYEEKAIYVPDTGPGPMGAVRNALGQIIGTRQLILY